MRSQRALHQQPAHPDPKAAAGQLDPKEHALPVQLLPLLGDAQALLGLAQAAQRQQPLVDPVRQAGLIAGGGRWQHLRDGLGQISNGLVADLEQPLRQIGQLGRQFTQQASAHQAPGLAAGQKIHRPGGIDRIGLGQVSL